MTHTNENATESVALDDVTQARYEWCAIWHDSLGLSRAYGCAQTQADAERVADEEATAYKRTRPDVELVYRETHKLDTSGEYRRVARFG